MNRSTCFFTFLFCSLFLTPLYAGTQTLTTYYPAPNGNYNKLQTNGFQLNPSTQAAIQATYNCSFVVSSGLSPCPAGLIYFDVNSNEIIYSNGSQWETLTGSATPLDMGGYQTTAAMDMSSFNFTSPNPPAGHVCSTSAPAAPSFNSTKSCSITSCSMAASTYYMNSFDAGTPSVNSYTTSSDTNYIDNMYPESGTTETTGTATPWRVELENTYNSSCTSSACFANLAVNLQNLPRGTVLITYTGNIDIDQFVYDYYQYENPNTGDPAHFYCESQGPGGLSFMDGSSVQPPNVGVTVYLQYYSSSNGWENLDSTPVMTDTTDSSNYSGSYDTTSQAMTNVFGSGTNCSQDSPSYCTNYQFSRTYSWPIGTQPKTTDVSYLRLAFVKNATGAQHISDGTGSGTIQYYVIPIAVRINNLSMNVQFQQ